MEHILDLAAVGGGSLDQWLGARASCRRHLLNLRAGWNESC